MPKSNGKWYVIVHMTEDEFEAFKAKCEERKMTQTKYATALFKLGEMKLAESEKSDNPILIV